MQLSNSGLKVLWLEGQRLACIVFSHVLDAYAFDICNAM